jgi:fibronectin-binding autotransporter adhesin
MRVRIPIAFALSFLSIFALGRPAAAQDVYVWNYSGTNWNTSGSWSPTGVPTSIDTAVFDHATTTTVPNFSLSGSAATGQLAFLGPGRLLSPLNTGFLFSGAGNTLTVGTGGSMTVSPLLSRGSGGVGVMTFDSVQLRIADGTTFGSGSTAANAGAVEIGYFSSWFLRNGTNFRLSDSTGTTNYALTLSGGNLRLLPSTAAGGTAPQLTNGLGNAATQQAIQFHGGGTLGLQSAHTSGSTSVTTSYALNGLMLGAGGATVEVFTGNNLTTGGTGISSVQVTFGNGNTQAGLTRQVTGGAAYGTLAFNPNRTEFGAGGTRSRVFLATGSSGSIPTQNGVITEGTTAGTNSPYVIVLNAVSTSASGINGRFAGYGATGVTVATTTTRTAATFNTIADTENTLYQPSSGTATLSTDLTRQTLVIEPTSNNLTLDLNGHALNTNGLMLSGQIAGSGTGVFNITGGSLGGTGGATRNIFVTHGGAGSDTTLNISSNLAATGGAIVKSGSGFLALTGTTDQVNFAANTDIVINAGVVRGVISGANQNFGTTNNLRLRGGVFEVNALNGNVSFTRTLGLGLGQVSWADAAVTPARGAGGFSVVDGTLTVNIGNDGRTLTWNGTSGGDEFFVRSGNGLIFGSSKSNGTIVWANGLALDNGTTGSPESRVLNVISRSLPAGSSPDPNAKVRITGVIAGSATTSLTKLGSGGGWLELTAANQYAGNTYIESGLFQVSNTSGSATGSGSVVVTGVGSSTVLLGNGIIAPAAGKGVTFNPQGVLLPDTGASANPTPTVLTIGSAGTNNPVTFRQGSVFSLTANGTTLDIGAGNIQHGRLVVKGTGAITLENPALSVQVKTGFTATSSDVLGILDNQTSNAITGTFNGLADGATVNAVFVSGGAAGTFKISYFGDITGSGISITGGNDIVLYNFVPVPEPASVLGLCAVAAGLVGLARRARTRSPERS